MEQPKKEYISERLGRSGDILGEVFSNLKVIDDIASKIDLLALNASIEAARVGKSGRGFTVVADEISKLSEKTQRALSEITATVTKLNKELDAMKLKLQETSSSEKA